MPSKLAYEGRRTALKNIVTNIIKPKRIDDGEAVIQLETAVGAGAEHFESVIVARSRFLPVQRRSNLLLIKNDIERGQHIINERRMFESTPAI